MVQRLITVLSMAAIASAVLVAVLAPGTGTAVTAAGSEPAPTPPPSTFNVFYPEERPLTDCLGALQRPNCGSEARGGWAQAAVFAALVAGLGFIGWRIMRIVRRRRDEPATASAPAAGTIPGILGLVRPAQRGALSRIEAT